MEVYGSDLIQNYDVYSPPSALTPPISLHTGAAEEKPDLPSFWELLRAKRLDSEARDRLFFFEKLEHAIFLAPLLPIRKAQYV